MKRLAQALGGMLVAGCSIALGQIGQADADQAKQNWERQLATLDPSLGQARFVESVDKIRGFAPHVARAPFAWVGGSVQCSTWSGASVALDSDWLAVREATAQTSANPPPSGVPVAIRVIGFPDLRSSVDPSVYEILRVIHRSPVVGEEFDPVNLIRAVNTLQAMGESKALAAMKEYYTLCGTHPCAVWLRVDSERIIWIARLLYVSKDPASPIRAPMLGAPVPVTTGLPRVPCADVDTLFPLVVQNDVPFCVVNGYALAGQAEDAWSYVEYCRSTGRFREAPLAPSSDPVAAAEGLTSSGRLNQLRRGNSQTLSGYETERLQRMIWADALSAAGNLVAPPKRDIGVDVTPQQWEAAKKHVAGLKATWSPTIADFVGSATK